MLKHKPRNASFTLEERLNLLRILRTKIKIVDATSTDFNANETKKEAWDFIQEKFVHLHPDRQAASAKEIRELWRRMKHRARMEVRQKVQSAKCGAIPTINEDEMGWMPDQNHTVVDINDLGLEPDTKMITEFVPLLEEEATVLETRNGILQGVKVRGNEQDQERDVDAAVEVIDYEKMADENNDEVLYIGDHVKTDQPTERKPIAHLLQPIDGGMSNSSSESQRPTPPPAPPVVVASSRLPERHVQVEAPCISIAPAIAVPNTNTNSKSASEAKLTELSLKYLVEEHEAKMTLIRMKQEAAKAKRESAFAKRSAYDEKRMFYFEKRKKLHSENDSNHSM